MSTRRTPAVVAVGLLSAVGLCLAVAITPASAAAVPFSIATSPALSPPFAAGTPNYTVACAGHPTTTVAVTGTGASVVGGRHVQSGATLRAPLVPGQSVKISGGGHDYFIRCLPADFPKYTASVSGTPQTQGLLVTASTSFKAAPGHYVVAFDAHGVPVWWYRDAMVPIDAKFFGPSTIGWDSGNAAATGGTFTLRGLNGKLKHVVGGGSLVLDEHDVQRLPNGNYLAILAVPHTVVNLSAWGLSDHAQIVDNVIVELNADNHVVWSWSVAAHIDVADANINWHNQAPDVVHMNSIQFVGNNEILVSVRHFDAVYAIDMNTGAILWKLGGSPTAESLTVPHDQYTSTNPAALFSGQHDARMQSDGTLTLQDNGTLPLRPVRALRFSINTVKRTATELAQITDSRMGPAFCCGGVDRLSSGDWLASWGTAEYATELTPSGVPVLTVSYSPYFSYRVAPVTVPMSALRAGMDAMVSPLHF